MRGLQPWVPEEVIVTLDIRDPLDISSAVIRNGIFSSLTSVSMVCVRLTMLRHTLGLEDMQ